MSPMPSWCEGIRHTFTHHFQSFTVCCTIVNAMLSILLLRVYFWNHIFNISFQGAFRVPQEWCSWTRTHVSFFSCDSDVPRNFSAFQRVWEMNLWTSWPIGYSEFLTLPWPLCLSHCGCLGWSVFSFLSGFNVPFFLQLLGEIESPQMHARYRSTVPWGRTAGPLSPWLHSCSCFFLLRVSLWLCVPSRNPCPSEVTTGEWS